MVVDVRDVLDVDADTDLSRLVLIGQVELGVVGRDADGLALGADLQLLVVHGKPFGGLEGLVVRVVHEGGDLKVGEGQEDQNLEHRWFFLDAEKRRKKTCSIFYLCEATTNFLWINFSPRTTSILISSLFSQIRQVL